jgi:hypothetical protein
MEKILMKTDRLDDDSLVVNFDIEDDHGDVVKQSGYLHVRLENNQYVATFFNANGDVLHEINTALKFKQCEGA